jgi:DNA-binding transcriptional regulator GbsR (MarR family)
MSPLNPVIHRFIEDAGNTTQSLGLGRVLGQIYAYLYFSQKPRNLADMQHILGISKGSASTVVRQLEQWNAVRKVWVRGDRKDYYEANDWLGEIIRNILVDTIGKKLAASNTLLDSLKADLNGWAAETEDHERDFIETRIQNLRSFQQKAQKAWTSPIVRMMLK